MSASGPRSLPVARDLSLPPVSPSMECDDARMEARYVGRRASSPDLRRLALLRRSDRYAVT